MTESSNEAQFVRAFVVADKQQRWLEKLASARHRQEFLQRLAHGFDFDSRFVQRVPPAQQQSALILELLRRQGARDRCQLIAARADLDRQELSLSAALESVVGMDEPAILLCRPGELAYFESEELGGRYVLAKQVAAGQQRHR